MPTYLWHQQAAQQSPRSILANRLYSYRSNIASPCKTDSSTALNCCHSLKHLKGCQEADWQGCPFAQESEWHGFPCRFRLVQRKGKRSSPPLNASNITAWITRSQQTSKSLCHPSETASSFPTCQAVPLFCYEQLSSERIISHPV